MREYLIELMLYTLELAVRYLDELGDSEEGFYDSTCNIFDDVCLLIRKNKLEGKYIDKCRKIVESSDDKGYGLYDSMSDIFYDYFGVELD